MLHKFSVILILNTILFATPPKIPIKTLNDIKQATVFANSLEKTVPNLTDKRSAKKIIYQHFRQGFSDPIANRLTAYLWDDIEGLPKDHDISLYPPDPSTIMVLHYQPSKVVITYKTPQALIDTWNFESYTIETLEFINNRWIITHSKTSAKPTL